MQRIETKRIYDAASRNDGFRVLVDRIWPRGVSKEDAAIDRWAKDIAPSSELRRWFAHDADKWTEFRKRYREELEGHTEELREILESSGRKKITLLYGAKDTQRNHALVLKEVLESL